MRIAIGVTIAVSERVRVRVRVRVPIQTALYLFWQLTILHRMMNTLVP